MTHAHRLRPRRLLPLLAAALLGVSLAAALHSAPARAATLVAHSPDFATDTWGDPWDYSNPQDLLLDQGPVRTARASITGGTANLAIHGQGYISPLWAGYPGALRVGREGGMARNQIPAANYPHLSFRLYADRATSGAVFWFTCGAPTTKCEGGQPFSIRPGWRIYDLTLRNDPRFHLPAAWSGRIQGLRLALNGGSGTATFRLDWMRVHRLSNQAVNPGEPVYGGLGDGRVDTGALPPGTWGDVTVDTPPLPRITDPDEAGGADYATSFRHDPWDMSNTQDVASFRDVTNVSWSRGVLSARNGGPVVNDPYLWLRLGRAPINPRLYHRLTFRYSYAGPFNLTDTSTGGTMARFMWHDTDAGATTYQTNDIVTYSGWRSYTIDMAQRGINETSAPNRRAWTAPPGVTGLRFDPNETRGPRLWHLDGVWLRADDATRDRNFVIRWNDPNARAGMTVSLYADTSYGAHRGQLLAANLAERANNTWTWNANGVPAGTYWVYAVATDGVSSQYGYASGPLKVGS